jgi:SynChlorMet cassette protein ScmC
LNLGPGLSWCLSGAKNIQPSLERLAHVLGLRLGCHDAWTKLLFGWNPRELAEDQLLSRIPVEGWNVVDLMDVKLWSHPEVNDLLYEIEEDENRDWLFLIMSLVIRLIYRKAVDHGGLALHAALIERDGIGIALAGSNGRGKSTCCKRIPSPWRALCDDHTLLLPSGSQRVLAHPFPTWSQLLGRGQIASWNVQQGVPLSAILFLEQSQDEEALAIGPGEAAVRMNRSANEVAEYNVSDIEKVEPRLTREHLFQNVCDMSKRVKCYILKIRINGRFWDRIDDVLPLLTGQHTSEPPF